MALRPKVITGLHLPEAYDALKAGNPACVDALLRDPNVIRTAPQLVRAYGEQAAGTAMLRWAEHLKKQRLFEEQGTILENAYSAGCQDTRILEALRVFHYARAQGKGAKGADKPEADIRLFHLKRILDLGFALGYIHKLMAEAFHDLGDDDSARLELQTAYQIDPYLSGAKRITEVLGFTVGDDVEDQAEPTYQAPAGVPHSAVHNANVQESSTTAAGKPNVLPRYTSPDQIPAPDQIRAWAEAASTWMGEEAWDDIFALTELSAYAPEVLAVVGEALVAVAGVIVDGPAEPAIAALSNLLEAPQPHVRRAAEAALTAIGDERALAVLRLHTPPPDAGVPVRAASADQPIASTPVSGSNDCLPLKRTLAHMLMSAPTENLNSRESALLELLTDESTVLLNLDVLSADYHRTLGSKAWQTLAEVAPNCLPLAIRAWAEWTDNDLGQAAVGAALSGAERSYFEDCGFERLPDTPWIVMIDTAFMLAGKPPLVVPVTALIGVAADGTPEWPCELCADSDAASSDPNLRNMVLNIVAITMQGVSQVHAGAAELDAPGTVLVVHPTMTIATNGGPLIEEDDIGFTPTSEVTAQPDDRLADKSMITKDRQTGTRVQVQPEVVTGAQSLQSHDGGDRPILPMAHSMLECLGGIPEQRRDNRQNAFLSLLTEESVLRLNLDDVSADYNRALLKAPWHTLGEVAPHCQPLAAGVWTEWIDNSVGNVPVGAAVITLADRPGFDLWGPDKLPAARWILQVFSAYLLPGHDPVIMPIDVIVGVAADGTPAWPCEMQPDSEQDATDFTTLNLTRNFLATALLGISQANSGAAHWGQTKNLLVVHPR